MVLREGLEPPHLAATGPKPIVSTNSTTGAEYTSNKSGVDEGDRTLDRRSHNPELYQLSYVHHIGI